MTSLSASDVHACSFSSRRQHERIVEQASFKSDVLLVVFWAAMIPGLMWLGSVMGY